MQLGSHLAWWQYAFLLSLSVLCHYCFFEIIESNHLSKSCKAIFVVVATLASLRGTCLCTYNSLGRIREDSNGCWSL